MTYYALFLILLFQKAHRFYPNLNVKKVPNTFRNSFLVEIYSLLYFKIQYVLH